MCISELSKEEVEVKPEEFSQMNFLQFVPFDFFPRPGSLRKKIETQIYLDNH